VSKNTDIDALAASIGVDLEDWTQDAVDKVPSHIAYAYDRLAEAKQLLGLLQAQYRRWRGIETTAELGAEPKKAEWKIRSKVDEMPKFATFKRDLAEQEAKVERWNGLIHALKNKVNIYQSRTGWKRDQLKSLGQDQ